LSLPEVAPPAPAPASSLHPEMIGVSGGGDNGDLLLAGALLAEVGQCTLTPG